MRKITFEDPCRTVHAQSVIVLRSKWWRERRFSCDPCDPMAPGTLTGSSALCSELLSSRLCPSRRPPMLAATNPPAPLQSTPIWCARRVVFGHGRPHVVITNEPHLIEFEQVGLNAGLSELLSGSAVAVSAPHVAHHAGAARPGPSATSPWSRPVAPPWILDRKISRPETAVQKKVRAESSSHGYRHTRDRKNLIPGVRGGRPPDGAART